MFVVNKIEVSNDGKRISYDYSVSSVISKYFKKKERLYISYSEDVSSVPDSLKIVPLIANIMPIAWFVGFDVVVEELDKEFYNSINQIKEKFKEYYSKIPSDKSNLVVKNLVDTSKINQSERSAMLFSGGVDTYCTFFRHCNEKLDLITINGADIKLDDVKQWNDVLQYNVDTEVIKGNLKYYIASNFRDFITFEVDKLLPDLAWWGKVQHGLCLTCAAAPLSYIKGFSLVYIASSYTRKENYDLIIWGSMPEIDNLIKFGDTKILHDAEELTRQEKIVSVVNSKFNSSIPLLRVCYSDNKVGLNCSNCEKCLRTIIAIMISGANPNLHGFEVDEEIFLKLNNIIKNGFSSSGNRLFWNEIYEYSIANSGFYNENEVMWNKGYEQFFANLQSILEIKLREISPWNKIKLSIMNAFPKTFKFYLKIRRKQL